MTVDLSHIVVRKVKLEDIGSMTGQRLAYLTNLQGERDEEYKLGLKKGLDVYFKKSVEKGNFFALLAEYKGHPIAFGGIVIKQIPGDFNKASYTIPEIRRKGISSLILAELLNEAKGMGISKVSLHTCTEYLDLKN